MNFMIEMDVCSTLESMAFVCVYGNGFGMDRAVIINYY